MLRQLIKDLPIIFVINCLVLVLGPPIIEMSLNATFQATINGDIIIEMANQTEEFTQLITIIQIVIEHFEILEYLKENSHEVGEDGYSEQEDDCTDEALFIASWVEVSEAYCRK